MEKNKITCLNNFYIRYANLSFDKFENIANQNDITLINKFYNEEFKREILLSSESLYNNVNDNCTKEDIILSLLKYMIRSSTRCTPYGSLSGVGLGNFSNSSSYNMTPLNLYFRVDNEWLMPLIPKLEKEIGNDIYIIINNDIEINDKKIVNEWSTHYYLENNFNTNEVIVNNTKVVKKILELTKKYIRKKDLVNILLNIYGNDKMELINKLLNQLLNYEILISNLRLCPLINEPLKEIIKISKENNYSCLLLNNLKSISEELNILNSDFSISKYENLIQTMKKIYDCKNIIRVDSYYKSIFNINENTKKDLENYVNFITKFSINENKYLNHCTSFIDKFGNVKVPVKYAFDSYTGIGLPKKIEYSKPISDNGKKLIHFLNEKVKTDISIDISELSINNISPHENSTNMELAFYPIISNNEINYITSPYCASNNLFESFGRFNYIFKEDNSKLFKKTNIDYVEITYTPKKTRIQNVVNCTTDCEYYLEYTTNSEVYGKSRLTLDDIYVSSDGSRFYYYNNLTGHQIKFNVNNKAMHDFMPPILNFILDSSQRQGNNILYFFNLINNWLEGFDNLPEIRYKNFIVSPQKWRLDDEFQKYITNKKFDDFCILLDDKMRCDQIPNKVFFEYLDNRLLLDLNNKLHKKILYQQIKSNSSGILVKNYFNDDNLIAIDNNGKKHVAEIIFQFNIDNSSAYIMHNSLNFTKNKDRILLPFNKWIYFNIYVKDYFQDNFLIDYIMPFLSNEKSLLIIKDYFYIKYIDDLPHIRLRVQAIDNNRFITDFNDFISNCKKIGYVVKYSINPYEREIERYGYNNIDKFESLFCENTYFSMELLYLLSKNRINYSKECLYIMTIVYILFNLQYDYTDIFDIYKLNNVNKKEYQQKYKFIENIMYPDNTFNNLRKASLGLKLYSMFENYTKEVLSYFNYEKQSNDQLLSYFHMFHNRLLGINREQEKKLNCYIERVIYGITSRKKYSKNR